MCSFTTLCMGWSTLPFRLEDTYKDVVIKCDLELVFLKCWAFGEIKQICGPAAVPKSKKSRVPSSTAMKEMDTVSDNTDVILGNEDTENVITHKCT